MKELLIFLLLFILLAGCIKKPQELPVLYKNDVITIENYAVSTLSPYSDSTTTIEFDLVNNADEKVNYTEVNFFDVPGFSVTRLECKPLGEKRDNKCIFEDENALESLDLRHISLELKAPKVNTPTSYTVSFSVKYNHTGLREALIPIVDGITKKEPTAKFTQSKPSYGPIQLDIQPSLEREKKVDGKIIKEYWGVRGRVFEVKFRFSHVGTIKEKVKDVNISAGNVWLTTTGLNRQEPCDFDYNLRSNKPVFVPYDILVCNFNSVDFTEAEITSTISASFNYTYEYIKSETFVVQPRVGL